MKYNQETRQTTSVWIVSGIKEKYTFSDIYLCWPSHIYSLTFTPNIFFLCSICTHSIIAMFSCSSCCQCEVSMSTYQSWVIQRLFWQLRANCDALLWNVPPMTEEKPESWSCAFKCICVREVVVTFQGSSRPRELFGFVVVLCQWGKRRSGEREGGKSVLSYCEQHTLSATEWAWPRSLLLAVLSERRIAPSHLLQPTARHQEQTQGSCVSLSFSLSPSLYLSRVRKPRATLLHFFPLVFPSYSAFGTRRDHAGGWCCVKTPAASSGVQTHPHCTAHPQPREEQHGTWTDAQELGYQGHRISYVVLSVVTQEGHHG